MKYIEEFRIFEGITYDFEESDCFFKRNAKYPSKVEYEFFDKSGHLYVVHFTAIRKGQYIRDFFIDEPNKKPYDLTGFGDVWNVMQTVTDITLDFLKKYQPYLLKILHAAERGEDRDNTKRALINKRFLERTVTKIGYNYELESSVSTITKVET